MAFELGIALALFVTVIVYAGPKLAPYSRKQWMLLMFTLIGVWLPMLWYLIFVVVPAEHVNTKQFVRVAALNMLIGVPVLILVARKWILRR